MSLPFLTAFQAWAASLRFPQLVLLAAILFLADLVVPDALPFVDEILLGVLTMLLAQRRRDPEDR